MIKMVGRIKYTFQEIFWFYDQDGGILKGFVPVDQAPNEIADLYNLECKKGRNINLRNITITRQETSLYRIYIIEYLYNN